MHTSAYGLSRQKAAMEFFLCIVDPPGEKGIEIKLTTEEKQAVQQQKLLLATVVWLLLESCEW